MPRYTDDIDASEISSIAGQSQESMLRVSEALRRVNTHLETMNSLMGKSRDYSKDELANIQKYQSELKATADLIRAMNSEQTKGMDDYSIAVKAAEDRLRQLAQAQKDGIEQRKKAELDLQALSEKTANLENKNFRIKEAASGRLTKDKRASLEKELGVQGLGAEKLRKHAEDAYQQNNKEIRQSKEKGKNLESSVKMAQEKVKTSKDEQALLDKQIEAQRKLRGMAKTPIAGEQGAERKAKSRGGIGPLEVLSDLHIPGVSHAATVAKYARRGVEDMGEEAGMGMKGLGLVRGGLLGGAVAGLGYTAMQGYRTYDTAQRMAPLARTLGGQMGPASIGARQIASEAYGGYGGIENMQALAQLNRQVGGQHGISQLRKVTDISNRFGIERGEVMGQAGQMFQAGVSPAKAADTLEKVMMEGVKAGMDRARITEFTQEVLQVQKEIFRVTGEENTQNIAGAFAKLAGGQGEKFFHGPAMGAIQGIDQAVKSAGRGSLGGPALGTIFRSFGFGAEGKGLGTDQYYEARKKLEGGVFQGKSEDIVGNLSNIIGRFTKESGGNKKLSNLRMADELGIGINQIESLRGITDRAQKTGGISREDTAKLESIMQENKDPMVRLLDIQAKSNANLAKLAGSAEGLNSIIKIDEALLSTQEMALKVLETIAGAVGGNTSDQLAVGLGALGVGALLPGAGKAIGGAASTVAKGASAVAGGVAKGAGALGRGVMAGASRFGLPGLAVAGAGAAGVGVGTGLNYLIDEYGSHDRAGGKSDYLEEFLAKVTPEALGGVTSDEYKQMYAPKGAKITPPRPGKSMQEAQNADVGAARSLSQADAKTLLDVANTRATADNTEAVSKLTQALMLKSGTQRSTSTQRVNVR